MTTLLLIRHAQSENNAKEDFERVPDPGLTDLGDKQAVALAEEIGRYRIDRFYCSPFLRTLQTLAPTISKTHQIPIIRQDLFEQGGCYRGYLKDAKFPEKGLSRSELAVRYPNWEIDPRITDEGWNNLPTYETIFMARSRAVHIKNWFTECVEHQKLRVAMMIHADLKRRLLESFLEIESLEENLSDPFNTSVSALSFRAGRWRLDFWNQHHHLPEHLITS